MKKYELVKQDKLDLGNYALFRIRALRTFGNVKAGDLGGYVESEKNLSHDGNAWIYDQAAVSGNAAVTGNALVSGHASVSGDCKISGDAIIGGWTDIQGDAQISGRSWISSPPPDPGPAPEPRARFGRIGPRP